jgi:acetylornithine/succinyldiaminopimelate/putrescine aminotransferase
MPFAVFASGGSEAVDIAIKTARAATGRRRLITLEQGYHGRTGLSGAAGEDGAARYFLSDRPDEFIKVPFGDLEAVETILQEDSDIAGVLIETVPATYGFPLLPPGYLKGIADLCQEHDILYIADEVQAGLGRSGRLWAVEAHDIEPDILITAKGSVRRHLSHRRRAAQGTCRGVAPRTRMGARLNVWRI